MLLLSKNVNHIINITATLDSSSRENMAKSTKSLVIRPWTINELNAEEEAIFEHERKINAQVKYYISEGILRVIPLGGKRDSLAEEAAAVEAEEKAQEAAAELESASTPAAKKKAQAAFDKAKATAADLRAKADAPAGLGDAMPKTLDKIEDTRMAADLVEGVLDLGLLNTYLRAEKRSAVKQAIEEQIKRVKALEDKAKEQEFA